MPKAPSLYTNTPLPAPPRALKSHPRFVVSPGGAGARAARGIKAAAAAVVAQSSVRPAAGTVGPREAPGTRTCLQHRLPGHPACKVTSLPSPSPLPSLELGDEGPGRRGGRAGLGRAGGSGSLRPPPSARSERHLELGPQFQRHQEPAPAAGRRFWAPGLPSQRGPGDSVRGSEQVPDH